MSVKAKKHLGQHFLKDESIAENIADSLTLKGYDDVLEIGPGIHNPIFTFLVSERKLKIKSTINCKMVS